MSERIAFVGGDVVLADQLLASATLLIAGDRIEKVGDGISIPKNTEVRDITGSIISPGFIDLHVHGGGGADFMDGTPDAVATACRAHARHGTTTIFPTTTTGSSEEILQTIEACKQVRDGWTPAHGARIAGIHLYGPYFAADKVGCHPPEGCRLPSEKEYREYFQTGMIRIATCAAELPGAIDFFRAARRRKCLITCGHSNATWQDMAAAFKVGLRHVDHFWCAMSSVASLRQKFGTPMQASMEQYVLAESEMSTEVIADGQHLSPELLYFAWKMKGSERLCLVTDCSRALDMPAGEYRFGSMKTGTVFTSDGKVGRSPNGGLASSVVGMDQMVRTMAAASKATLWEVIRMASLTPAERAGVAEVVGSIDEGKRADLVILSPSLKVREVWLSGQKC